MMNTSASLKLHVVAAVASFVLVSLLVLRVSTAAFTASTDNAGNSWATGEVTLSDDDGASAMFSVTGMVPGQTVTRCIEVTYDGTSDPAAVKLFGAVTDSGLSDYLDVTVEEGTAATDPYPGCTGFTPSGTIVDETLTAFSARTDYSSGLGTWDPAAGTHSMGYRFTVTMNASTPNTVQGASAQATFTWATST